MESNGGCRPPLPRIFPRHHPLDVVVIYRPKMANHQPTIKSTFACPGHCKDSDRNEYLVERYFQGAGGSENVGVGWLLSSWDGAASL